MEELREAYIKKLGKMLCVEDTIIEHMPSMIDHTSNEKLRDDLTHHLKETREHKQRLLKILGNGSKEVEDKAFILMVETAGKEIEGVEDPDVRDAVIIAAAQGVEHFEMARYGTLIAWAKELGEDSDDIRMLKDTLGQEESADKKLSTVAEGGLFSSGVNAEAVSR